MNNKTCILQNIQGLLKIQNKIYLVFRPEFLTSLQISEQQQNNVQQNQAEAKAQKKPSKFAIKWWTNDRKPTGILGRLMIHKMNKHHTKVQQWGISYMTIKPTDKILDVGCGGGKSVQRLLKLVPQGHVTGLDYSQDVVKMSIKLNSKEIKKGHCDMVQGSVNQLPFEDHKYDYVTAFETIYFWPNIQQAFEEIRRVLNQNGTFSVICECRDPASHEDFVKLIEGGLTFYTPEQVKDLMEKAGFFDVKTEIEGDNWMYVQGTNKY